MSSSRLLCLVLGLLIACAVGNDSRQQVQGEEVSQRRQLRSWSWYDFLNLVHIPHPPCPPDQGGPAARGNCKPKAPVSSYSPTASPTASPSSSGSYNSVSSVSGSSTNVSQSSSFNTNSRRVSWWWLVAAGLASVVIGAAVWGRKKMRERHILDGSVKRRMGLFSQWADTALCGAAGAGAAGAAVEMTNSKEDKTYERMA